MDKIIINEAHLLCNIGVSKEERKKKQEIIIDAELFLDIKKASQTDDIKNAANYSEVYEFLKDAAQKKEYKLIETLAEEIAESILNKFPIEKITVRVKKPAALANRNVKSVAVEITREK